MKLWIKHGVATRVAMLRKAHTALGIDQVAIEKDWWVTMVLKALFECSCSKHLIFKGGTSLSKGWNLIERFSEDIDLSINHEFFGIEKTNKSQREKLRKTARRYIFDVLSSELVVNLMAMGVNNFHVENVTEIIDKNGERKSIDSDKDPTVILVHYDSVLKNSIDYIPTAVKIEISCLSMNEPTESRLISSYIEQTFPGEDDGATSYVRTVLPTRTFLEKAFLLCEELQKQKPRHVRMSRHLYDLEKMMDTTFGREALADSELYQKIVYHRSVYYAVGYVDYSKLQPSVINFIPQEELLDDWKNDYAEMRTHFIYGESLPFNELLKRMHELQDRFRSMK